jgi:subtilase family serine protease
MKRSSIHRLFPLLAASTAFALCASSSAPAQTGPSPRITAQIDASSRVTLAGSRPPRARAADDIGAVPATLQLHGISLLFSRSPAQQTALDALVAAQQNPTSSLYHRWITPDQYAAQFGVADSDLAAAESWLEQQGFSIDSVSRSRNRIFFSGTAAQVANAFSAPLHYYLTPATAYEPAKTHFAPSADLTLPAALGSSVLAIGNLSDFHLIPHILRASQPAQPRFTSSQTGNHYLTPGDIATIYDITPAYNSGFTGSNQSIAVIGQSDIDPSDISNFQAAVGIAAKTPVLVLVPNSGTRHIYADGDEAESDLDLEYSSTIAKGAQVYFVYTGNSNSYGAFNSIEYAIDERIAPIISSSYGQCEPSLGQAGYTQYESFLEQAAAQGQTVLSAAGDNGSTDCYGEFKTTDKTDNEQLAVDYPASSQYVTAVGGTEFPTADVASTNSQYFDAQSTSDIVSSAKSYIPEMVWNDDPAAAAAGPSSPLSAGGGGASMFAPQPTWQTGTIGGVAITNTGHRMLPDIALTASPFNAPFAFCTSDATFWATGQKASCNDGLRDSSSQLLTVGGGTSFEAPTVAGLVAIINQAKNSTGQGVINSTLYTLAATSAYATAFHDITSGGNQCTAGANYCTSPGTTDYAATTGYDEASGLGSLDFYNLLTAWPSTASSSLLSTSTTLTAATTTPASGAADAITITVAPVTSNASVPTGTVAISVDGGTATSQPLTAGIATYSFSSTTTGAHVVTATYSGDTIFAPSTGSITLDVGGTASVGTFAITANPANVALAPGATSTGTITVSDPSGSTFSGTVTLSTSASTLTDGCIVLGSTSVALTATAPGTTSYTLYASSSSACTATGAARPGIRKASADTPHQPNSPWKQLPLPASLAGALLILSLRRSRRLRSKLLTAGLALGLVFALSFSGLALTGCGGSSTTTNTNTTTITNTPAGTYTIIINGASGTTTGSANITLTVS